MAGLDKKSKRKGRTHAVDMSARPEPPPDEPMGEDEPSDENQTVYPVYSCVDGYEAQVVTRERRLRKNGKLVAFAAMVQVRGQGEEAWMDVERVDCAHGQPVHVDRYDRKQKQHKNKQVVPPECRENLDSGLRWALDYIWDVEGRLTGWR